MPYKISSFSPIVGDCPLVLILGTMPSVKSLEAFQYYAHPRNAFWEIVSDFCQAPLLMAYENRKEMLIKSRIALWDVCASCHRVGSLDSAIRQETPNAIASLLAQYPSIHTIIFNGQPAQKLFQKHFHSSVEANFHTLPSTSPTNTMPLKKKKEVWHEALSAYLHNEEVGN